MLKFITGGRGDCGILLNPWRTNGGIEFKPYIDFQEKTINNLKVLRELFNNHFKIRVQLESQTQVYSGFQLIILRIKWRLASIQYLELNSAIAVKYWMPPKALGLWESEKTVIFSVDISTTCESYSTSRWVLHHNAPRKCILASSMSQWAIYGIWHRCFSRVGWGFCCRWFCFLRGILGRFTWQYSLGTRGWESLLWYNCVHPHRSGWLFVIATEQNYPPDFSFWLFRV